MLEAQGMKAVILAGGLGSRLMEETQTRPKPMVEIGGRPILWHILKIYSHFGINDFIVCLGYKGYVIKEYFANYFLHASDVTFDLGANETTIHHAESEPWRVTLVNTGDASMTGGRLKRVRDYVGTETFCFTYGDAVSDVDVQALVEHHRQSGRLATVTAVQPPGRFGALRLAGDLVGGFEEKPTGDHTWINGGFFVLEPAVIDYIASDATPWEGEPMERLVAEQQLAAFPHAGFWQPMDTLRDRNQLEHLWASGQATWRRW
jgi:glucose-1-phosphate cytidylyltransferase